MADRTKDFKRCVQSHRAEHSLKTPASEILKRAKPTSSFTSAARDIARSIDDMSKLLHSQRDAYMDLYRHLHPQAAGMTDEERNQMDDDTMQFVRQCGERLEEMKQAVGPLPSRKDPLYSSRSHQHGVLMCLYYSLQGIAQMVQEQRRARLEYAMRSKSLFHRHYHGGRSKPATAHGTQHTSPTTKHKPTDKPAEDEATARLLAGLTLAERQQLEMENTSLLNELVTDLDMVREAERKMNDISNLVGTFATKVLEQQHITDHIFKEAQESTHHVEKGAEQLSKALARSSSYGKLVSMFILVMAFCLLFLDWFSN
eukprot:GILK01010041.1.p1 GENE.GILK01010041.1~~GILK01010041.1.p1  ORF type:complete len:324 (+),score=49.99 GILK01010041.1:31-972(+)